MPAPLKQTIKFILFSIAAASLLASCGGGSSEGSSVSNPVARAYVTNYYVEDIGDMYASYKTSSISQYNIDENGNLTPMATPTAEAGSIPISITVDPSAKYAYVANFGNHAVAQYSIDADGNLIAMLPATVPSGRNPYAITIHPSGQYLYTANYNDSDVDPLSNGISQYTIGTDGKITGMTPAKVAAGWHPHSINIDPSGKYAYVTNYADDNISQYNIASDGSLGAMSTATVAAGTNPFSMTLDPSGKYAYVANFGSHNVSQYNIDAANGMLTVMTTVPTGDNSYPRNIIIDPSGKYAYVTNFADNNISQYSIGADGSLTAMATATVSAGTGPSSMTITKIIY